MATKLTCMAKGQWHFFIVDQKDRRQLGEHFVFRVTEAAMLERGQGHGTSKKGGGGDVQRVQRPGAIASDDDVHGLEILHRTTSGVKFNRAIMVRGELTHGNQILSKVGGD